MKWDLRLFGQMELRTPDGRVFATKSHRLLVLIAYLGLQPDLRAKRKVLAQNLFDPMEMPTSPNMALLLTRATAALSKMAPTLLLDITVASVGFYESNVVVDVADFYAAVRAARREPVTAVSSAYWRQALQVARAVPLAGLDHPLLLPEVKRLSEVVLESMVGLVQGPIGDLDADLVLSRIREFALDEDLASPTVERLMRVYAALGFKRELISTFTQFENHMDDEFGDPVPKALADLFESLLKRLDDREVMAIGATGPPVITFGRESLLADLEREVSLIQRPWRLLTVTGLSGIGKTHILKELVERLRSSASVAYFDLEFVTVDAMKKSLRERPAEVILVDHVDSTHAPIVADLVGLDSSCQVIAASHTRLGLAGEQLLPIGSLPVGTKVKPGPAVELLHHSMRQVRGGLEPASNAELVDLAERCEGVPLALEVAGRLAGTIGAEATAQALSQHVARNGTNLDAPRSSLAKAIASSYEHLDELTKRLVRSMVRMNHRVHVGHVLTCTATETSQLEEAVLSGLVVAEVSSPYAYLRPSARETISDLEREATDKDWTTFCEQSVAWFKRRSQDVPLDWGLSDSLPLVMQLATTLAEAGNGRECCELIASVRPWIGSAKLSTESLALIEPLLLAPGPGEELVWGEAVAALGAAYFHASEFARMQSFLERALLSTRFPEVAPDLKVQIKMQLGLAKRALGDLDSAVKCYREAIATRDGSVTDATIVKCYYNLGTVLEHQERLADSLSAHEAASSFFGEDTDPRVESLVNTAIGRLRYRLGGDLESASFILEATIAHANQRQDYRSMGETLQNLGLISYERGLFLRAVLAESMGSLLLLSFGHTSHFLDLARSSFVTLCASLLELGEENRALSARTMIDLLGDGELYPPNKVIFERISEQTYKSAALRFRTASEAEVKSVLLDCFQFSAQRCAELGECQDLLRIATSTDRLPELDDPVIERATDA